MRWRSERVVVNPRPAEGLSSSLRRGLAALGGDVDAALVVLGDQPHLRAATIRRVLDAAADAPQPFVFARHEEGGTPNPVLVRREAWVLADGLRGDRGFGSPMAAQPQLVLEVPVEGANPDVDTPADLAALAEEAWAARVRANREQVDRIREVPDGSDFYRPVSGLFRADPDRTDDPVLARLLAFTRPGQTWLDIGAGAGRYALPIARLAREVIAVEPSAGMLTALREGASAAGISNVRLIHDRWPMANPPTADIALIAHVGYDVEAIGPFLDAMEAAARQRCVAALMDSQPASLADPFWRAVHGEPREPLPALAAFVELLHARGADPRVTMTAARRRRFASRDELEGFVRRQLWIAEGGPKEGRLQAALRDLVVEDEEGVGIVDQPTLSVGVVAW